METIFSKANGEKKRKESSTNVAKAGAKTQRRSSARDCMYLPPVGENLSESIADDSFGWFSGDNERGDSKPDSNESEESESEDGDDGDFIFELHDEIRLSHLSVGWRQHFFLLSIYMYYLPYVNGSTRAIIAQHV